MASSSPSARLEADLPPLLSAIAGMVDVLGYLLLGHIFTAHITGNLVLVAASLARGGPWSPAQVLTMPVFVAAVGAVWAYARVSPARGVELAYRLVAIQFVLLCIVFASAISFHLSARPQSWIAVITAMLAVCAMATQYALFRLAMPHTISTAVMTGNLTNVTLAVLDALTVRRRAMSDLDERVKASARLLIGFFAGCVVAAAAIPLLGDWASLLPVLLGATALVFVAAINRSTQTQKKGTYSI